MIHRINLTPAGRGKTRMTFAGQDIGTSDRCLYAAARYLLTHELAEPENTIQTWRDGMCCMSSSVAYAAAHTIREDDRTGPVEVAFRAYEHPHEHAVRVPRGDALTPFWPVAA